ncbi:MAG: ABC transporter ATP-binding protein [Candidatus Methanomethylophilaceae archaeon]|nr:ABC transporter ATP-binding protein [Candidatus Methanomethylophilaceae archaeon]
MSEPIIQTDNLTYSYTSRQTRPSLNGVSLTIGKGVRTVILGANGAGKSTLFYHFNGIFKPKKGKVLFDGQPIDYSKEALKDLRSKISVVVQNPDEQIFSATVEEDIAFGPMNCGMERDEIERRIQQSLFKVDMEEYRKRPTIQLSYGQRKRIAMAGALAIDPEVLVLDEPTAGLDSKMSQEVIELAEQLCVKGTTVIISTHDVDLAYAWAEEIHVLRYGKLIYSGEPEPFFSQPDQVALAGLALPHTFSVNDSVERIKGNSPEPYPRTNSQLLSKIGPHVPAMGHITIVPVTDSLPEIEDKGRTGVYGFNTRHVLREKGMKTDYTFNSIECCMIDALNGRDSTIYCDTDLVEFVKNHAQSLERFGRKTEVTVWGS